MAVNNPVQREGGLELLIFDLINKLNQHTGNNSLTH